MRPTTASTVQLLPTETLLEVFKCCAGTDMPAVEYVSRRWNGITRTHAHHLPVPANPFAQKLNVKKHSQWPGCLCFSLSTLLYFCLFTFFTVYIEELGRLVSPYLPTSIIPILFLTVFVKQFELVVYVFAAANRSIELKIGCISLGIGLVLISSLFTNFAHLWYLMLSHIVSSPKEDGDGTNWLALSTLLFTSVLLVPLAVAVLAIIFIAFAWPVIALQLLRLRLPELRFYGLFRASDRARYTFLRMVCSPLTIVFLLLSLPLCTLNVYALIGVSVSHLILYIAISLVSENVVLNTMLYYFSNSVLLNSIRLSFDCLSNLYGRIFT